MRFLNISISPWVLPFLMGLITLLFFLSVFASGRAKYILLSMMCFVTSLSGGYIALYPELTKSEYIKPENAKVVLMNDKAWKTVYRQNDDYYMNDQKINIIYDLSEQELPYLNIKDYTGEIFNIEILKINRGIFHVPKSYDKIMKNDIPEN